MRELSVTSRYETHVTNAPRHQPGTIKLSPQIKYERRSETSLSGCHAEFMHIASESPSKCRHSMKKKTTVECMYILKYYPSYERAHRGRNIKSKEARIIKCDRPPNK
jgi:hypothetical protein